MHTPTILLKVALASFCMGVLSTGSFAVLCEIGARLASESQIVSTPHQDVSFERQKLIADLIDEGLEVEQIMQRATGRM